MGETAPLDEATLPPGIRSRFVDGAGHWVQQEQPERVVELLVSFLREQALDELAPEKAEGRERRPAAGQV